MPVLRRARRAAVLLAALPVLAIAAPAPAFELQIQPHPTDAAASRRVQQAGQWLSDHLPGGLVQAMPARVHIRWSDRLPDHVAGRAHGEVITLGPALADPALPPEQLQAALLHELVHLADRGPHGGWSRQARLRELAGWQQRPWRLGRSSNAMHQRSPDLYELHSPAEFLAVNAEHWLLDPDYACRRPALAAWFDAHWGAPPQAPAACSDHVPLLAAGTVEGQVELLDLDPSRVYAVDYLHAEHGRQVMSRWGHSMLRLVICRPGRPLGPDCRLDMDQHRVLSFRAFVGDMQLSSWRGLTGGYPSRLFVLPLQQVIDEYTQVELRGLASLPLRLGRAQISALLEQAAQRNWAYDGRYYFVSNNCAVETAKLLRAGVPALQQAGVGRLTPAGVRKRLRRAGMLDETVLEDRRAAERDGYYFPAADAHFDALFAAARAQLPLPVTRARDWLALDAEVRARWLTQGDLRSTAGLLLLEQAALRRAQMQAREQLKRLLVRGQQPQETAALQALLQEAGQWLQPAGLLPAGGYGLPQANELAALQPALDAAGAQAPQAWRELRTQLQRSLPRREQAELEQIEQNLATLGEHLRALAREQG